MENQNRVEAPLALLSILWRLDLQGLHRPLKKAHLPSAGLRVSLRSDAIGLSRDARAFERGCVIE